MHADGREVYDGTCPKFRTLVAVGFVDLVRETIAVPQLLSFSSWHLVHRQKCDIDRGDDAWFSMVSQRSLQQYLNQSIAFVNDDAIVAVLAHAIYAVSTLDHRICPR